MKKRISLIVATAIALILTILSCNKGENIQNNNDNNVLKRYLEIKSTMATFQKNNGDANLEALGASIMNNKKKSLKSVVDSGWVDTGWIDVDTSYWQKWTCANVNEYIDTDGNNVTVYDYGTSGCDDWGSLIKGKVTYIWSQKNDIYFSKVLYENYSAYGMTMNGYSEYSYSFGNMIFANGIDSTITKINWSGSSSCNENIEMAYENGETFQYTADYSSDWNGQSCTVHQGEYSYKNITNGYEYTYKVTQDLFYNYECGPEIYVPVSGIEEIIYKDVEVDTKFITNYGNGTCDNLATISENGVDYTVDFGNLWYTEPCGNASCDSVVVYVGVKN